VLAAPCAAGVVVRPGVAVEVAAALVVCCLLANVAYLINDVCDREEDRIHSRKRTRPVAAGELSPRAAVWSAGVVALLCILFVPGVDMIVAGIHHNLIFAGHKMATIILCALVAGHLYMALVNHATRPALSGMVTGKVDREWWRKHYPRWEPVAERVLPGTSAYSGTCKGVGAPPFY
jgi:UbiA prenyltransferase family/Prokaryotic cytochrome b561